MPAKPSERTAESERSSSPRRGGGVLSSASGGLEVRNPIVDSFGVVAGTGHSGSCTRLSLISCPFGTTSNVLHVDGGRLEGAHRTVLHLEGRSGFVERRHQKVLDLLPVYRGSGDKAAVVVVRLQEGGRRIKHQLDQAVERDHRRFGGRIPRRLLKMERGLVRGGYFQEVRNIDHCGTNIHPCGYGVRVEEQNSVGLMGGNKSCILHPTPQYRGPEFQ